MSRTLFTRRRGRFGWFLRSDSPISGDIIAFPDPDDAIVVQGTGENRVYTSYPLPAGLHTTAALKHAVAGTSLASSEATPLGWFQTDR